MDNIEEIVITVDTEKGKVDCSVINTFVVGIQKYIALMPKNIEEILLFKYKELEGDAIEIISIEDITEFNEALNEFDKLMVDISEEQYEK